MTALTKKSTPFIWTVACQMALNTIKHAITNSPVLMYPNHSKEYHLFTAASNHTWSGVLIQQQSISEISSDKDLTYHQITYQSGTFSTSQLKWSTIVQEYYTIMMSL